MTRQLEGKRGRVTKKGTTPVEKVKVVDRFEYDSFEAPSSIIVPIIMFGSLIMGIALILVNYLAEVEVLGMPSNWYLLGGLGLILLGISTATKLR